MPVVQGWGMTETSPLAATSRPPGDVELRDDEAYALRACQGRPVPLVEARLAPDRELEAGGPFVARAYYRAGEGEDGAAAEGGQRPTWTDDGWLRTGDVAELERGSYLRLVDRTKNLVKSGGEWISSVQLENAIMAHPEVVEAGVVATPDSRWGERPCAFVVRRAGAGLEAEDLRAFLDGRAARWWLPDRVEFIDEVPKTSVGKFDNKRRRARLTAA